jgi:2,3-bisphosphoglycerate-dependent phosphoglycerate mutase
VNYLVLMRHGQSVWNKDKKFTGHADVDLTKQGEEEARRGGAVLSGISFDHVFTSTLKRAYRTAEIALEKAGQSVPQTRHDLLRERNYGDLTGFGKDEIRAQYGADQVRSWRLDYDSPPPNGESLKDVLARVEPYYRTDIEPLIKDGKNVLLVAHEHPLRAMLMILGEYTHETIVGAELPTGVPLVFEMENGNKISSYYMNEG